MSRPIRRGRLDVLDRVRPGLADTVRARVGTARDLAARTAGARATAARTTAARPLTRRSQTGRDAALASAAAAIANGPRTVAGASAALETALDLHRRSPGAAADRLVVAASGLVRAGGAATADPALAGVPQDEAVRLTARLAGDPC